VTEDDIDGDSRSDGSADEDDIDGDGLADDDPNDTDVDGDGTDNDVDEDRDGDGLDDSYDSDDDGDGIADTDDPDYTDDDPGGAAPANPSRAFAPMDSQLAQRKLTITVPRQPRIPPLRRPARHSPRGALVFCSLARRRWWP
jgi:hypothetical protein